MKWPANLQEVSANPTQEVSQQNSAIRVAGQRYPASLQILGAKKIFKSILKARISLNQGGASQLVQCCLQGGEDQEEISENQKQLNQHES